MQSNEDIKANIDTVLKRIKSKKVGRKMKPYIENIRIEWDGPFSLNDIGFNENKFTYSLKKSKLNDEDLDYGVYQIYGNHPVYGNNVLLYIGKAQNQTFAKRISQEYWHYNEDFKNIQIYVGRIYDEFNSNVKTWEKLIDIAERLLIYSHEPSRNSSNILNITGDKNKLKQLEGMKVLNYGNYRSLMPEISGEIWIKSYDEDWKFFGED